MGEQDGGCDFEAMAALSDHHKRFEPFVGEWSAEVRMWMGPGEPMVATGVMTNTLELGGRFLAQRYEGDASAGPFTDFEGRGFWGYNTVTGRWEGVWVDTASTMMMTEQGELDASGKVWTMHGEMPNPQGGPGTPRRSIVTLVDDDHHTMEMFMRGPDGAEHKNMEIRYTRRR